MLAINLVSERVSCFEGPIFFLSRGFTGNPKKQITNFGFRPKKAPKRFSALGEGVHVHSAKVDSLEVVEELLLGDVAVRMGWFSFRIPFFVGGFKGKCGHRYFDTYSLAEWIGQDNPDFLFAMNLIPQQI